MNRAVDHHSSLLPIFAARSIAISLLNPPIIEAVPQVGSISWMGRTGVPSASAVDVNLSPLQGRPDGPIVDVRPVPYIEIAVVRPLQLEDLPKKEIKL